MGWLNPGTVLQGFEGSLADGGIGYHLQTMMALTCGTMLLMWLGEQITERGIGNGVSLVITIGIVADLPRALPMVWEMFAPQSWTGADDAVNRGIFEGIGLVALLWVVVMGVVAVTQAQRKIPVQHAQRAVGRKVYAGGSSFMPLLVNYAGVLA